LTYSFWHCNDVKAICIQKKSHFECWSFPGVVVWGMFSFMAVGSDCDWLPVSHMIRRGNIWLCTLFCAVLKKLQETNYY
jgi:hypothetical protein